MDTKVIVVCNNKGGVGKSTCTAGIADILSRVMGYATLVVDTDPQGNLSGRFGYRPSISNINNSLEIYLMNELNRSFMPTTRHIPINKFFNPCFKYSPKTTGTQYDNLRIICSTGALEMIIATFMANPEASDNIIRNMIHEIKESKIFNYILIDTQPNLSYFLRQTMLASDYVLVPVEPVEDSLDGAKAIGNVFNSVMKKKQEFKTDDKIDFLGVFFNKWRKGTIASKKFENELLTIWGDNPVLKTKIPFNQEAVNSANKFAPITIVKPTKALIELTKEMVIKIDGTRN